MRSSKFLYLLIAGILVLPSLTQAASISFSDAIALQSTNWNETVEIGLFDTDLGTLNSILFELWGDVKGDAKFESLDSSPATVEMTVQATITLTRPDLNQIAVVIPVINTTDAVTAFDGNEDFGGTSGKTYSGLEASDYITAASPPPPGDISLFAAPGGGIMSLPVTANALSFASGAGNLRTEFAARAGAEVKVTYNYTPHGEIPEPGTILLLGTGLLGLVGYSRRRKTA